MKGRFKVEKNYIDKQLAPTLDEYAKDNSSNANYTGSGEQYWLNT